MKQIMVSIHPKWAQLIFNGVKTMEIRKTLPHNGEPFLAYVYVTKKNPLWIRFGKKNQIMSGHVVGYFICDGFDRFFWRDQSELVKEIQAKSRVSRDEMAKYAGNAETLFAWHITDVVEFDEVQNVDDYLNSKGNLITQPPLSWVYVEDLE
ncbi:MAG: hypothetical protein IKE04_05595 [Oscillospiraceae bacterium]|nr:hypothetical protein [Oscillospiraceae bacterium]